MKIESEICTVIYPAVASSSTGQLPYLACCVHNGPVYQWRWYVCYLKVERTYQLVFFILLIDVQFKIVVQARIQGTEGNVL